MRPRFMHLAIRALSIAFAASLLLAAVSDTQTAGGQQPTPIVTSTDRQQTMLHELTDVQTQSGIKVDSREQAAYDAFFRVGPEQPDKKIQMGNEFLQKYPKSIFAEAVDAGLTNAYYAKQDWQDFYASADKALALKPDDVDVLTTVGWVIPHFFNPNDPDVDQRLDKAETFEKHAIQVLEKMPKPDHLSEAQFKTLKAQRSIQAHSALGLVYFRREDYDNSAKELQQATQNNASPDQTDLFVLGASLLNLDRPAEAADAFDRCGQMEGGLQDRCKQNAAASKKQAARSKTK
jgi:tetratricopeptide (TPR) repeat protein